jgi:DNA-binding GntR family transcriptional regulator
MDVIKGVDSEVGAGLAGGRRRRRRSEALSGVIYGQIRQQILTLELRPGARLNIDQLAFTLSVSATPVREALGRLAAEHLVVADPFRGFAVSELPTPDELEELTQLRRLLEGYAVAAIAGRDITEGIADIEERLRAMERLAESSPVDYVAFNAEDAAFHEMIISLGEKRSLLDCYRALNVHAQVARLYNSSGRYDMQPAILSHRRIVAALTAGDSEGLRQELHAHAELSRLRGSRGVREDGGQEAREGRPGDE